MTWGEFKRAVDASGARDGDAVGFIHLYPNEGHDQVGDLDIAVAGGFVEVGLRWHGDGEVINGFEIKHKSPGDI